MLNPPAPEFYTFFERNFRNILEEITSTKEPKLCRLKKQLRSSASIYISGG